MKKERVVELLTKALGRIKSPMSAELTSRVVDAIRVNAGFDESYSRGNGAGVFAISSLGWVEAQRLSNLKGVGLERVGYLAHVKDPEYNALAAALLFDNAHMLLRRNGMEATAKNIYDVFINGWSAFKRSRPVTSSYSSPPNIAGNAALERLAEEVAAKFSLPVGTGKLLLSHEAGRNKDGSYNARSRNTSTGDMRGLMQFSRRTWNGKEVQNTARKAGFDLGKWEDNAYDPYKSIVAAMAYARSNVDNLPTQVKRKGVAMPRITPEVVYGMHQQGLGGFVNFLQSGELIAADKQSKKSRELLAEVRRQYVA